MIAFLTLPPEKQRLSFRGVELRDGDSLYALGCRTDDAIDLEFESPSTPEPLRIVREPAAEKPAKKEKGGDKKGK